MLDLCKRTQVGMAGVKADSVMKKTRVIEDPRVPVWDEESTFPLTVPELALVRVEVQEYDMSWELKKGKGVRHKSVRLLMRFDFV